MRVMKVVASVTALTFLGACASASKDIATASVSPLQYQSYDCEMLRLESQRLHSRVTELGGRLDTAANNDKAITAAAIVVFWPAAFFLGGNKAQEAEYARLKGEAEAINQASVMKKCVGPNNGLTPVVAR
jgi:hypothetical protein